MLVLERVVKVDFQFVFFSGIDNFCYQVVFLGCCVDGIFCLFCGLKIKVIVVFGDEYDVFYVCCFSCGILLIGIQFGGIEFYWVQGIVVLFCVVVGIDVEVDEQFEVYVYLGLLCGGGLYFWIGG